MSLSRAFAAGLLAFVTAAQAVGFDPSLTDLNGDGRSDILWRSRFGQVYRMLMNGPAIVGGAVVYQESQAWKIAGDGDFNGDGITDVLWRNDVNGAVYVMPFGAAGTPLPGAVVYTEPNQDWKVASTADLNGDGRADILWWNQTSGQVFAMLMNGTSIVAQGMVYSEPNTLWRIVGVGDFTGSGRVNQLLWRHKAYGSVYLMTVEYAAGSFTQSGYALYFEPNTAWKIVATADFNGDGRSDILWRNDVTGQVYMMLMWAGQIAAAGIVYTEPNLAWKIVAVGDYDGDGRSDMLWRNFSTGQVYMMLMNGGTILWQGPIYTEPDPFWRIQGSWDYAEDDTFPATSTTVSEAIQYLANGTHSVPARCYQEPKINCVGTTPMPTPLVLTWTGGSIGTSINWSIKAQSSGIYLLAGDTACQFNLDTTPGTRNYASLTGTWQFSSSHSGGPTDVLQMYTSVSLESVDIEFAGGFWDVCASYVSNLKTYLQDFVMRPIFNTLLCGEPGPELFTPLCTMPSS